LTYYSDRVFGATTSKLVDVNFKHGLKLILLKSRATDYDEHVEAEPKGSLEAKPQ